MLCLRFSTTWRKIIILLTLMIVAELDMDYDAYLNAGKTYSRNEVETHTQELLKSLRAVK